MLSIQTKQELKTLQKQFDREIDRIFTEMRKKNPNYQLKTDQPDRFLQSATEKYQINTDQALVLYNKLCFLKQKE